MKNKTNPEGFVPILILIVVFVLVGVGYFGYKNYWSKQQTLVTVSPTPTTYKSPVPTTDPTINWKMYTNTQYGFSLKYPSNMVLEQITSDPFYSSYVNFKNGNDFFSVRAREGGVQDETDQIRAQTEGHVVTELIRNETLQVGGVTATLLEYTFEGKNNNRSTLIIPSGKNIIVINAQSDIFDQILSTFKFTN